MHRTAPANLCAIGSLHSCRRNQICFCGENGRDNSAGIRAQVHVHVHMLSRDDKVGYILILIFLDCRRMRDGFQSQGSNDTLIANESLIANDYFIKSVLELKLKLARLMFLIKLKLGDDLINNRNRVSIITCDNSCLKIKVIV